MSTPYRVVLCGEMAVGKTALVERLIGNPFAETCPTISATQVTLEIEHKGQLYTVALVDTAGQERFRAISSSFFANADIVMFVYAVTSEESLGKIPSWVEVAEDRAMNAKRILVGNKIDLVSDRIVTARQGSELAEQLRAQFLETSAATMEGVADLQEVIGRLVAEIVAEQGVKKQGLSLSETRRDDTLKNRCQC